MREEIIVGHACGGKPGSRGGKVILLNHMEGHHHSLSLSTHQHWLLNNREADPSNAWCTELQSRTPPRGALEVPDVPIYRVGPLYVPDLPNDRKRPQAGKPAKVPEQQSY